MSSHVHFIKKFLLYNVFQYEIPDRMSHLRTLCSHFKNFRKFKFQWDKIYEKTWCFASFPPIFNLKAVLISPKIGKSK